ncbi:Uncharacterised protein [Escherichia coli]|nr:Uncharacterised protein [Escherichia coli]
MLKQVEIFTMVRVWAIQTWGYGAILRYRDARKPLAQLHRTPKPYGVDGRYVALER